MRYQLFLRMLLTSLYNQRLRSIFACLVIAVAVCSGVLNTSIEDGASQRLEAVIDDGSANQLIVNTAMKLAVPGRGGNWYPSRNLKLNDAVSLQSIDSIQIISPEVGASLPIEYLREDGVTSVNGVMTNYFQLKELDLEHGRFFTAADDQFKIRAVVIGATVANRLFGRCDKRLLGEELMISGIPFEVIGCLKSKGISSTGGDRDDNVYIPLNTAQRRLFNVDYLSRITLQIENLTDLDKTRQAIEATLNLNHRIKNPSKTDFEILGAVKQRQAEQMNQRLLGVFFSLFSSVTLFIAGVGVMAVTYLNTKERRTEFGLRKALGARWQSIAALILIENNVLTVVGIVFGLVAAYGGVSLLQWLSSWSFLMRWGSLVEAALLAIVLSTIFSLVPALIAAKMRPVAALANDG